MDKKAKLIMLAVGMGTFMASLDSSVVNLAMPMIRDGFGVSISFVEWIVTAYLLVVSSLLLTFGRIADLYGYKKVYLTGFSLFVLGSLLCGLSSGIVMLIASRVVQALGAGMLYATGPAIITNAVPPAWRGRALSITAIAVALGLCAGPVIGGMLATLFGWQSIFFINLPVGVAGIAMVVRFIPRDEPQKAAPFDIAGSILIFIALLFILAPLSISGDYPMPVYLFVLLIAVGIFIIVLFVLYEKRKQHPMLNIALFGNRVFSASNAAALLAYMAQFIMVFMAPFYLESLRQFSAMASGLLYMPMPLATMCIAPVSGRFADKFDSRYLSAAGNLVMAGGLFMLSFLDANTSIAFIVAAMVVTGLGFGMFQTPNNSAIMGNVPPQNRGTASGTLATMRNIGMAVGVAISGALFSFFQASALGAYSSQGQTGAILQNNAFHTGLHSTFLAAAIVSLIAVIASLSKGKMKVERAENAVESRQ